MEYPVAKIHFFSNKDFLSKELQYYTIPHINYHCIDTLQYLMLKFISIRLLFIG